MLVRGAGFPFELLENTVHAPDASSALRQIASDPKFREAVTWQNRAAVTDGLDSLLRKPPGATDAKTRKKELLVLRYLQRYCAKNDTIGFFGPVGWAKWGTSGRFVPQQELIEARRAFLEPWVARVLADSLASPLPDPIAPNFVAPKGFDPRGEREVRGGALVWIPGDLRVQGRKLITPTSTHALTAEEAKFLARLPAKARALPKDLLASLVSRNIVRCTFPVAISHDPLKSLPPVPIVQSFRAFLAKPDLEELPRLEAEFTAATQHAAKRHEGRTYGGRGLVYEECRRAVDLELSAAMRARVDGPLSVVLQVARWYTHHIATTLTGKLEARFTKKTPLHVFWAQTADLFEGPTPKVIAPAVKQLRARWAQLWKDRTELTVDEARAFVDKRFAAPHPGWPGARHHAPDLMWAAPSAEAMLRGEGTPILGELHPAVTPFTTLSVLAHAPDRAALERQWKRDFGEGGITPIPWEDFARSSQDARLARQHWHLDLGFDFESDRPAKQVLRAADFDVVRSGKRLVAVHREKKLRFDLLQIFERRLKMFAATNFSLGDGQPNGPRRTLGGVVVQRAHWRFTREQLAFLDADDRATLVQAFLAQHGLPRRVFVRSPEEVKPVYLDWSAPLLVEQLARLSRHAEWLSFSEMLPGPEGLWLRDAHGHRYVCELRCIAVDPEPWRH